MSNPSELDVWRLAWKAETEPVKRDSAFDVRQEAMRQQRRLQTRHILELCFAVVLIGFAAFYLKRNFSSETLVWAIVIWILTLGATAFSIWNWRALWTASNQSTSAYAAAYRRRCMAGLRAIRFGYRLLALELVIVVPWLTSDFYKGGSSGEFRVRAYLIRLGLVAFLAGAYLFAFRRSRRRTLLELARLEEFERGLPDEE